MKTIFICIPICIPIICIPYDFGLGNMKHYVATKSDSMILGYGKPMKFCKHLAEKCLDPKICVTHSVPD